MTIKSRIELKAYFETGDKPTEQEFADLIESFQHKTEDPESNWNRADAEVTPSNAGDAVNMGTGKVKQRNLHLIVINKTAGALNAFKVVRLSGYNDAKAALRVVVISDYVQKVIGILPEGINVDAVGYALRFGAIEVIGFDTSGAALGDLVYSDDSGNLTLTPTDLAVGRVMKLNANGVIYFDPCCVDKYTMAEANAAFAPISHTHEPECDVSVIDVAETEHTVVSFENTNSALNNLGSKINEILVALGKEIPE